MVTETLSFDINLNFLSSPVLPSGPGTAVPFASPANRSESAFSELLIAAPRAPRLDEDEDDDLEEEEDNADDDGRTNTKDER